MRCIGCASRVWRDVLRFGSLFAGVGGFDLGLEAVGWRPVWQVERDGLARGVLACRWPRVVRFGDVRDVSGGMLEPVDVVCGGFPCQDVSIGGSRSGLAGEMSGLFFEFVRIVVEMREVSDGRFPRWVLWENVPGLVSGDGSLAVVYAAWDQVGAVVQEHRLVDARFFGVPQRRRRVFGVACFDSRSERGRAVLSDGGDVPRVVAAGASAESSFCDGTVGGGVAFRRDGTDPVARLPRVFTSVTAHYAKGFTSTGDDPLVPDEDGRRVRRLTPRECERLMGWPDDHTRWTDDGGEVSDRDRYRMCGNGVVAPMAQWLGRRVMVADESFAML